MFMFSFFKKSNNGGKDPRVITDAAKIDAFLERGIENIFPSKDFVRAKMLRGERLSMYLGIDPTGKTLHFGHAIPLRKLAEFQKLGHQVILLIGDFTAMIGDPTDKSAARRKLTRAEVLDNARLYKDQASKFLDFSGPNRAILRHNSEWLDKLNFGDVLELASLMTVDQMLKRDMFAKRMEANLPIYIHEFMYPLMQGYDSVAMDVDGEIGGNDQTFNMLAGRDLMKSIKGKEKFVMAVKLLTDSSGKKMGKTEGNMVSLDQTADDMFGKVMSWSDGLILPGFEICTDVPLAEIAEIRASIEIPGANPRDAKVRLAKEIVSIYHSRDAADAAYEHFMNTFKKGEVPEDAVEVRADKGAKLSDLALEAGLVASKGEFRRLAEGKGVSEVGNGDAVLDFEYKIERDIDVRLGKKRFLKVRVK